MLMDRAKLKKSLEEPDYHLVKERIFGTPSRATFHSEVQVGVIKRGYLQLSTLSQKVENNDNAGSLEWIWAMGYIYRIRLYHYVVTQPASADGLSVPFLFI